MIILTGDKMLDIENRKILICGIQGSGKTYFANSLTKSFGVHAFVYAIHPEDFKDSPALVYSGNGLKENLNKICGYVKEMAVKEKVNMFIIDEADLFFTSNFDLASMPILHDLILNHRHYGLTLIFATRRPQDIPTKIVESCHHIIIFKLEGENAIKKFKEIDAEILPLMENLKYLDYRFIIKSIGDKPYICEKI
jgi:DNA helicase HerA-like ATPase